MIVLPDKINLLSMHQAWDVSYIESPGKLILIEHAHGEVALYGKNYPKRAAKQAIIRWVKLQAQFYLTAEIEKLNKKAKAKYKKVIVHSHSSLWGSYSDCGTIRLDYKLIFLPTNLMKHILYHELCHYYTMEHSDKFWKKLKSLDRNCKKHKEALRTAEDDYIPEWALS